jgi:hypothetical protein
MVDPRDHHLRDAADPIVYYYLRAPDPEVVLARDRGWYRAPHQSGDRLEPLERGQDRDDGVLGRAHGVGRHPDAGLDRRRSTAASPLVFEDSPYNVSHARIQEKFGGVEPLIIVAEGKDRDAMKDPKTLRRWRSSSAISSATATSVTASR